MTDILSYEFMQNALFAAILASIACGLIGPFIVARRMVFISGGLSHTAFGGLGIAYWLGIRPIYGATVFVLAAALFLSSLEEKKLSQNDLFIGIFWAVGVAIGIVFVHLTPGYAPDLLSFLFGNILTVPRTDVAVMLIIVFIVVLTVAIFYKGFVAIALDEEFAQARHLPVQELKTGLTVLAALTIVTLIQVVGILLVIALLTIPVAIASELSMNFRKIIVLAIFFGIASCLLGLFLSYSLEFPSGAAIILTGGILLAIIKSVKGIAKRSKSAYVKQEIGNPPRFH
ncbi:MAG: metal ABC transporter permease [Syntrophobacterales bacterium]|nr:metal ABC transporter permease [Syntrophobacterales bacterium]